MSLQETLSFGPTADCKRLVKASTTFLGKPFVHKDLGTVTGPTLPTEGRHVSSNLGLTLGSQGAVMRISRLFTTKVQTLMVEQGTGYAEVSFRVSL